jgi:hypothetical protein
LAIDSRRVAAAVDLSRLHGDPVAELQLSDLFLVGRESDLLEAIRRSKKDAVEPLDLLWLQASKIGIPPQVFGRVCLPRLRGHFFEVDVEGNVSLKFTNTEQIYAYATELLKELEREPEKSKQVHYCDIIADSMVKPIPSDDYFHVVSEFGKPFRKSLYDFAIANRLLTTFNWKNEGYVVSHHLYKDDKRFREAMEILDAHKVAGMLNFILENPGNPSAVVERHLRLPTGTISALSNTGVIEPIRLDVEGDTKEYLFAPTTTNLRQDQDEFDPVKMTLSNFRFGEYYSKKTQLRSLDEFLSSLLDRGFAGWAEPIGTDYRNIEGMGVLKVVPVSGNNYRFWLLKRDVIEDVRSIVRGTIPIKSDQNIGDITSLENLVQTRRQLDPEVIRRAQANVNEAVRELHETSLG